jgi:5-bromo-4-chloroindolyl phosphate hydrolysis protein
MPEELSADATFEEEQQYMLKKQEYDSAQQNLQTLEKYLNAYDKLKDIKFVNDMLNDTKNAIMCSDSEEKVSEVVDNYKKKLMKCRSSSSEDASNSSFSQ